MDQVKDSLGTWAKRYYYANRLAVETLLRAHGVGATQWLVLRHLAAAGPTAQRDLGRVIGAERAALSGIVSTLVRKGFVEQLTSAVDQRRRELVLTPSGRELLDGLPDPFEEVRAVALAGIDHDEIDAAIRVLERAIAQVQAHDFSRGR
ncbi:MarR family winged helix-turn-helix transcriptional regulator [Leifsonia virtsii]|uniref:MarR family transcriptional regulator n=1 Tax=Leifsonia virtsii TaxID=3035915 RepID=A0ABT8IVB3_9MICO|nr:MarR family transcriptional regulator [Leifsonia virtsii]MDN4596730.1 MarR family transcriptional regulator [Leifsonia virtsii]